MSGIYELYRFFGCIMSMRLGGELGILTILYRYSEPHLYSHFPTPKNIPKHHQSISDIYTTPAHHENDLSRVEFYVYCHW